MTLQAGISMMGTETWDQGASTKRQNPRVQAMEEDGWVKQTQDFHPVRCCSSSRSRYHSVVMIRIVYLFIVKYVKYNYFYSRFCIFICPREELHVFNDVVDIKLDEK